MGQAALSLEELVPCWSELTPKQRLSLKAHTYERLYEKGHRPHLSGESCSGLFIIKSGQLRVYMQSKGGREVTLYRLFDRDVCLLSASCIMKGISFDLYVQAEQSSDVYIVPAELYERLMQESLPVANYTSRLMASHFSDVMWAVEQILFTSLDSRLAAFLLEQSRIEGSRVLPVTHEEIAGHIGSAREAITKMLNYLAEEGMVALSRGRVTLLDREKLRGLIE